MAGNVPGDDGVRGVCGIGGVVSLKPHPIPRLLDRLTAINELIRHRGPDGAGMWTAPDERIGFAHRRLAIIDLTDGAAQPMHGEGELSVVFNGEIYNYLELRDAHKDRWTFRTQSDTECILAAYARHGLDALNHLHGMFAFALWDGRARRLVLARDRFGIKPLYYAVIGEALYFASEAKALLAFLPRVDADLGALSEYLSFQIPLTDATMFSGVRQLDPGAVLTVEEGRVNVRRYWRLNYEQDQGITQQAAQARVKELLDQSIDLHVRADVDIGAYLSGGVDSSLIALSARAKRPSGAMFAFHGKFSAPPGFDESSFAHQVATAGAFSLDEVDISAADFPDVFAKVIRALDQPVAGPGAFPQYVVAGMAAQRVKVVLGGQGGDEIFGGYARYLVGYLDQALRAAIAGKPNDSRVPLGLGEISGGLGALAEYAPLIQRLWSGGALGGIAQTYRILTDRSDELGASIDWSTVDTQHARASFEAAFAGGPQIADGDVFNLMLRFDLERLLPGLLQVEDRVSMAHGMEARVPFLDHKLVEYVASVPTSIKFEGGALKPLLRHVADRRLPRAVSRRRDKMGFPVPLRQWSEGPLREFFRDLLLSKTARERGFVRGDVLEKELSNGSPYSRKLWILACLEQWQQEFIDAPPRFEQRVDIAAR